MSDYQLNPAAQAAVSQWLKHARSRQFAILGDNDHRFLGINHLVANEVLMQELKASGRKHYFSEILIMPQRSLTAYQQQAAEMLAKDKRSGLPVPSGQTISALASAIEGSRYRNPDWRTPETDPIFNRYIAELLLHATKHGITLHSLPEIDESIVRGSAEWHKKLAEGIKARVDNQSAFIVFGGAHVDGAYPSNPVVVKDDLNEYLGKERTTILHVYRTPASPQEAPLLRYGKSVNGDGLLRTDRGDAVLHMVANPDRPDLNHLVGKLQWQRPTCADTVKGVHECAADTPPTSGLPSGSPRKEKSLSGR